MDDARASLETPCKVNLFLSVDGRRADGYHLLSTLFLPLPCPSDALELRFDAAPGIAFSCDNPELPSGPENLCVKAAQAYCALCGLAPTLALRLGKRIPVAAGLGGGSSDAAATLLLLNRRYGLLDGAALHALAAALGADVPFFLEPSPSVAHGVGELLEPLPFEVAPLPLLLVFPRFPISAAWAYKNLAWDAAKADARTLEEAVGALRARSMPDLAAFLRNDLSHSVRRKFPLVGLIERDLKAAGALAAQVSGSGSSLFALFPDMVSRDAARTFLQTKPGWESFDLF
jgi:4-diphosphocytidyl-2-C-methyl-D-erythritol kinase